MTTSARLLALLGLLQSRPELDRSRAGRAAGGDRAHHPQRHRAAAGPGLPGARRSRPRGRLPVGRLRAAAAPAALRRRGRGRRRGADRRRGERGPGRAHPDRDRQAGAHPARAAADPGAVVAGEHRRRPGQHRHERGRSRGRSRAAGRARAGHPPSGGAAVLVPRRRGGRSRPVPAGQLAAAVVSGGPASTDRRLAGVPGGLAAAPGAGGGPLHRGSPAGRGLRVVRAPRRRLDRLGRARPDPRRRPGRGGAAADQRHRRGGGDRRRRAQRAGHRRRQPGDRGRLDRHAGPAVPRRPAAGAGRPRPAAGGALPPLRCQPTEDAERRYDSPPALPVVPAFTSSSWYFSAASLGALEETSPAAASSCRARTTIDWTSMWK